MSIDLPILPIFANAPSPGGAVLPPPCFPLALSSPRVDLLESTNLAEPTIDPAYNNPTVNVLSSKLGNVSNSILNFAVANYRVNENVVPTNVTDLCDS